MVTTNTLHNAKCNYNYVPSVLLHTELIVSLFIRCTMRCEIWAQPAEVAQLVYICRALCLECRVSWVRVPPEAAHWKSDCLGCAVLLCFVACLTLLASSFLPSASLINMYSTCTLIKSVTKYTCAVLYTHVRYPISVTLISTQAATCIIPT